MPTDLRRHDQAGHIHFWTISCYRRLAFFWHDDMKQIAVDALSMLHERFQICLIAYVVMPDHLHAVLYPHPRGVDTPIESSTLLHAFKQHIGFQGKACLRQIWRREGQLWSHPLNQWARGAFPKQEIMFTRGHDFNINQHDTLLEKIDYCHKNPVTRGLVDRPGDWRWSSYRYYEYDDTSVLTMNWDGSWPVSW